jgi:hypothetical protein
LAICPMVDRGFAARRKFLLPQRVLVEIDVASTVL